MAAHAQKQQTRPHPLEHPVRFVTAASLFDGHDAAINLMRRLLQSSGAEVVHLGHNRSVLDVVEAAIEEDAQGIAISSYQGGHVEYFRYMVALLRERGAEHIRIFGGGGGVIIPPEIEAIEGFGVDKVFSPEDGRRLGLQGMINLMLERADFSTIERAGVPDEGALRARAPGAVARAITMAELGRLGALPITPRRRAERPVIGITGTGGAGKSSLTDELVRRVRLEAPELPVALLSVDPTRRRSGGALLGDRIRMNAIGGPHTYMRSLATRARGGELSGAIEEAIAVCHEVGFELVIVETSGIGQGDAAITEVADVTLYVMTSEFGAASQLEKIDMLDLADLVVINKFEKRGSADALRAVRKQWRRNHGVGYEVDDAALPVYGTTASRFNDDGVNALYHALRERLEARYGWAPGGGQTVPRAATPVTSERSAIVPVARSRYLSEIAEAARSYHAETEAQAAAASAVYRIQGAREALGVDVEPAVDAALAAAEATARQKVSAESAALLEGWPGLVEAYSGEVLRYEVQGRAFEQPLVSETLSGTRLPKVALPRWRDPGDVLRWLRAENVPGRFPYTAGVFAFKRADEDPKRQFAGEGTPARTNRRFHYLTEGEEAKRLSTAFDSVTLYGADPDPRPDIYGKVGESGVSVCSLDDMKRLYAGFDLCDRNTSVSMTINGPAPIILAMYLNAAIDQQVSALEAAQGVAADAQARARVAAETLRVVRGTVQADILKEDQAQNTCIFSTDFALRMQGDIQAYFIEHGVRNYYSVSISGYHIAEAGANPITQLAFTLANGFTFVEYYLSRGMAIDDFAPNLSFFFSNGLDAEYSVLGRVARRLWAVAMRDRYGANARSQKLKYHIQTSGRSLHAQEVDFNDIRTTIQALLALNDNCNSLHTNAYDEAITTPTEGSVRRAMAIQLILQREYGLMRNENALQGSFIIERLTDLVEQAVLDEFDALTARGGVLGAMETQYQRGKIQDESMRYEVRKHSGELPIIGVNTFLNPRADERYETPVTELARASAEEKRQQLENLHAFQATHADEAPAALARLQRVALEGGNTFAELMQTVRVASLGQITRALYEVGGQYRRAL